MGRSRREEVRLAEMKGGREEKQGWGLCAAMDSEGG